MTARFLRITTIAAATLAFCHSLSAQEAPEVELDRVQVLGSNIRKAEAAGFAPILSLERRELERSGLVSVGDILQRLTLGGKATNTQYNASGNFGAPPDGGGIGAGSTQVDLRHLEAKRVLVLVDGKRWVYESSASGVGGAVDLNTIPLSIVERVDVLGSGASAVYGSDAVAGVVNIVTRRGFEGAEVVLQRGAFDEGDGRTTRAEITVGGRGERFEGLFSASFQEQERVASGDREISSAPPAGATRGSPVTPQGRFLFISPTGPLALCPLRDLTGDGVPDAPFCDITTVPGAPTGPTGAPAFPGGFAPYTDAMSFNGQPFNLLLTPNKRESLFAKARYELGEGLAFSTRALYNRRTSANQGAANPIVIGPEAPGNGLADRIAVSRLNPYNPTGRDLIPLGLPGGTLAAIARRPVEGGPRVFEQDVETVHLAGRLEGEFDLAETRLYWDADASHARTSAEQVFHNTYNLRRIQQALGDPAACAATPGCVPLNLFGGPGTITPQMLQWIRATVHDSSEQVLDTYSASLSGDLPGLAAGGIGFAAGVEHRRYAGAYTPDQARVAGEILDQAATVPTRGGYEVDEAFAEFNVPLLRDLPFARELGLDVAGRYSRYSNFDDVFTVQAGLKWRPVNDLLFRANLAEGFRAPFIGELFGLSQFAAVITDPCSGYATSGNPTLIAQCQALGVPASYRQLGFQVFTTTGGNPGLSPETSDSVSLGMVYSPRWASDRAWSDRLDMEVTYYKHTIDGAIQAPNAQDVINACVAGGTPSASICSGIQRGPTGSISSFDNRLANIGRIETSGFDVQLDWALDTTFGRFDASWMSTYVAKYQATDAFDVTYSRRVGVEESDGAIPRIQSTGHLGWSRGALEAGWTARYVHHVVERCSDSFDNHPTQSLLALGLCSDPVPQNPRASRNRLGSTTYHDLSLGWRDARGVEGLGLALTVNNVFDKAPPTCFTCSLNGYDPSTYDPPGRFWTARLSYRFR